MRLTWNNIVNTWEKYGFEYEYTEKIHKNPDWYKTSINFKKNHIAWGFDLRHNNTPKMVIEAYEKMINNINMEEEVKHWIKFYKDKTLNTEVTEELIRKELKEYITLYKKVLRILKKMT